MRHLYNLNALDNYVDGIRGYIVQSCKIPKSGV